MTVRRETAGLARSPGRPSYDALNRLLRAFSGSVRLRRFGMVPRRSNRNPESFAGAVRCHEENAAVAGGRAAVVANHQCQGNDKKGAS